MAKKKDKRPEKLGRIVERTHKRLGALMFEYEVRKRQVFDIYAKEIEEFEKNNEKTKE